MKFDQRFLFIGVLILFSMSAGFYYISYQDLKSTHNNETRALTGQIDILVRQLNAPNNTHVPKGLFDDMKGKLELDVSAWKEKYNTVKKIHHLKFVIITKDEIHDKTRILVASIHMKHKDFKILIYGIRLHPNLIGELKLWAHVEFFDIEDFLASKRLVEPNEKDLYDLKFWRPVVLQHAIQRHGKVLLLDNGYILTHPIHPIEEILEKEGSWLVSAPGTASSAPEQFIQCDDTFQAYKYDSWAYNNVLLPKIRCGYKMCTSDKEKFYKSSTPPVEHREATKCRQFPSGLFAKQVPENTRLICFLVFREDFLYSYNQLPQFPGQNGKKTDGKIHIAIGFPSTSKNVKGISVEKNPAVSVLIPTFLATIKRDDKVHFYNLYLGFDYMDPFFDNEDNQKRMMAHVLKMTAGYPVSFQFVKCRQTFGWTTFLWNVIFQHAINDGNDFFYQVNDDLQFINPGWTEEFIDALKKNPVKPYLGVVGPHDEGNASILTQSFVHRTHYDIFGYYYPPIFRNWYSDDWVTHVYDHAKSTFRTKKKVKNSQVAGTRYIECYTGNIHLGEQLQVGNNLIQSYLREKK